MDNSNFQQDSDELAKTMECRRCGVCCTKHQAFVNPEEIQRIIAFLGITADDWENYYADPRWEYNNYRLIRHVNGACAFLKYQDKLATCTIQPVKPDCCSNWEPSAAKKDCREGMEKKVWEKGTP